MKQSFVYILECSDGTYYTGITSNLEIRLNEHKSSKHPERYTFARSPLNLAIENERRIKNWSKVKKKALIKGAYDELPNLAKKKFR